MFHKKLLFFYLPPSPPHPGGGRDYALPPPGCGGFDAGVKI